MIYGGFYYGELPYGGARGAGAAITAPIVKQPTSVNLDNDGRLSMTVSLGTTSIVINDGESSTTVDS